MSSPLIRISILLLAACSAPGARQSQPPTQPPIAAEPDAASFADPTESPDAVAAAPSPDGDAAPHEEVSRIELSWYDKAAAMADRDLIAASFARRGYEPAAEAHLLIGVISTVCSRPAYTWYSLGDTGFSTSFWPASMVKLVAAVGALETLGEHGLDGSSTLSFTDGRGDFRGPASRLYGSALRHSNNAAFDRLMKIAGFDAVNDRLLAPEHGFPFMTLQRPYDAASDPTLRVSPEISYTHRGLAGGIPRRESTAAHAHCPDDGNCATLFELLHFLQRVVLHDELDERDRFCLHRSDRAALVQSLELAPTRIGAGIEAALGHPVTVYNKGGRVPGEVANDHALAIDRETGRRYLVAASVKEEGGKDATKERLERLVRHGLEAVVRSGGDGVPAARSCGVPLELGWAPAKEQGRVALSISSPDGSLAIELREGREVIARSNGTPIEVERTVPGGSSDRPLSVYLAIARDGAKIVAYRALGLAAQ